MVTIAKKEVLRRPPIQNESTAASNKRTTRGTTKVKEIEEENRSIKEVDMPTQSGRRRKMVPKDAE